MSNVKLGDIAEIQAGPFGTQIHASDYVEQGIPMINAKNIGNGIIILNSIDYVSTQTCEKLSKYILLLGDIIFGRAGSIERHLYVAEDISGFFQGTNCIRIRCKKIEFSEYVSYFLWLPSIKKQILLNSGGSTLPYLNSDILRDIKIYLPPYNTIYKIVKILSSIDKKIELNNKINKELEDMAKTIYDYWFMQFDFPNEQGKPYKSFGGEMVWNDELKREIPKGWSSKYVYEVESNIITGKTPPTNNPEYYDGNVPFITIGDIRGNMFVTNTVQYLSKLGGDFQKNKYISKGAICVTCIASPGLVGFASKTSQTNQQINSIICKEEYNKCFLYFSIKDYFKNSSGAKTGNTFANMSKTDFSNISLIYSKEIAKTFYNETKTVFDAILNYSIENEELTKLRAWLLPMLMNGQATVE